MSAENILLILMAGGLIFAGYGYKRRSWAILRVLLEEKCIQTGTGLG